MTATPSIAKMRRARAMPPRPRELWRQRLRADILQEKLAGKKPEEFAQTLTRRYSGRRRR